jgi:ADP-ribosylation factor GTPase-activating protein 1
MDAWTEKQISQMKVGGNQQCNDFLQKHGIDVGTASTREKYDSPAAELYRQVLQARVEGKPEPTTLPEPKQPKQDANNGEPRKMQGFGSSPPPPRNAGKMKRALKVAVPVAAAGAAAAAIFFLKH